MKKLMENKRTKDLPVDKKLLMMKEEFPQLSLSRSTVWNVSSSDFSN